MGLERSSRTRPEIGDWAKDFRGDRINRIGRILRIKRIDNLFFIGLIFCKIMNKKQVVNS